MRLWVPAVLALAAYSGVASCFFWWDDFYWLFRWHHLSLGAFLLESPPGHLHVLRNAIVAATAAVVGTADPRPWFVQALLAHAATAVVLALVLARWTGSRGLAAGVAALWAVAPVHAGTLSYYTAAAAGWATLAGGAFLLAIPGAPAAAAACLVAAGNLFGTGLAFAAAGPVLALVLAPRDRVLLAWQIGACGLLLGEYLLLGVGHPTFHANPEIAQGLTVAPATTAPLVALQLFAALAWTGLTELVGPAAPVVAPLVLVGLWRRETRRFTTAGLLVAAAAYAAVGVGRTGRATVLGQTIQSIAATPYYHYFGQFGLALALGAAVPPLAARWKEALGAALAVLAALRIVVDPPVIDTHESARREMAAVMRRATAAARSGDAVPNRPFPPALTMILFAGPDRFPGQAAAFTLVRPDGRVDGRPVRFVAQSLEEYRAVATGGPIARVLLPPGAGGASQSTSPERPR